MIRCSCGNPLVSVEAICELCDTPVQTKPSIPTRPTTYAAVDAMLRERADYRGIPEHHRQAYLLGMCMQMLANANSEIARLERKVSELESEDRAEHDHECGCEACSWDRAADAAMEPRR